MVVKKGSDPKRIKEAIIEIVSDSGEGAQKCGQSLGAISAKMGNGVWTVEIIPAEIQPPARSREGASGIRVRIGSEKVTNMGNYAHLVVALNDQVIYGRLRQEAYNDQTVMIIDNRWESHPNPTFREQYEEALMEFTKLGIRVIEITKDSCAGRACFQASRQPALASTMEAEMTFFHRSLWTNSV